MYAGFIFQLWVQSKCVGDVLICLTIAVIDGKLRKLWFVGHHIPGKYITEAKAQRHVYKRATWFWKRRKNGELSYSKVGNRTYYHLADIQGFLERNKKGG